MYDRQLEGKKTTNDTDRRATGLVMEWAAQHHVELQLAWTQARNMEPLDRIEPLT